MLTYILEDGFFPEDDIKQELDDLPAYFPSKEPWRNLWHWINQKSEELDSMLEQFEQDFKKRKYSDIGVILHVFGLRLYFQKMVCLPKELPPRLKKNADSMLMK